MPFLAGVPFLNARRRHGSRSESAGIVTRRRQPQALATAYRFRVETLGHFYMHAAGCSGAARGGSLHAALAPVTCMSTQYMARA